MSELSQRFKSIMQEVETRIQNPEELEFVKQKISEISVLFLDTIDKITEMSEQKMKRIEERQKDLQDKVDLLDQSLSTIEKDIYDEEEEENYDFEIVCPYCNHEFTCDMEATAKEEVQCPECKNIIELDWNLEEDGCMGDCSCCHSECEEEGKEEKPEESLEEENKEDDDM